VILLFMVFGSGWWYFCGLEWMMSFLAINVHICYAMHTFF
jgi:hypothetical protein